MTVELLSLADIQAEIARRTTTDHAAVAAETAERYRWIRSLSEAGEDLLDVVRNTDGRLQMGIPEVDMMTRGFGRGELILCTGRAHSGKTQVTLHMVSHNVRHRNILLFTPDEVAPLVLSKLMAMHYGVNAEQIEQLVRAGDAETERLVRNAATNEFKNLIVVDDSLTLTQMTQALEEAEDYWSAAADLVIVDYLELIPGDSGVDGVVAKSQALKRWTKQADVPVFCLHQSSRSSAPRGQAAGLNSGKYGGEQEAIMLIEVYRKRENESLDEFDRQRHRNTITVNVAKNKRPPSKRGEVDLFIDPGTGAIRPLRDEDMFTYGSTINTVEDAMRVGHDDTF